MDVREKLVELLADAGMGKTEQNFLADHLIAHGVTVQGDKDINVPTKWIPVTERLPDIGIVVLVYSEDDGICVDYYGGDSFGYYDVTHWMPLPQPPKEGDEG